MAATASGPNAIQKVVFYKGDRYRIATDRSAPYGYTWKPGSNIAYGSHVIRAVVTDAKGNVAEDSARVTRVRP
jgi:Big-like domain-containing protein